MSALIDAAATARMIGAIADVMQAEKDRLCALDGVIGDGDHGIAMALGFAAARDAAAAVQGAPSDVLTAAAKAFLNAVGASSGPLYATGLLEAAKAVRGAEALDEALQLAMFEAIAAGVMRRGKAAVGDKTMVDAWAPAANAARVAREAGSSMREAAPEIISAAEAGAHATAAMQARLGRAARLGDRSLGHPDPGAVSAALMIAAMAQSLAGCELSYSLTLGQTSGK